MKEIMFRLSCYIFPIIFAKDIWKIKSYSQGKKKKKQHKKNKTQQTKQDCPYLAEWNKQE